MSGKPTPERLAQQIRDYDELCIRSPKLDRERVLGRIVAQNMSVILDALTAAQQQGQAVACVCCEDKPAPGNNPCACCGRTAPPSAPVGPEGLIRRIDAAIERVTSGRCTMRVPADPTDPDLVLADAGNWIQRHALAQQPAPSAPVGVEGGINVPAAKALIEALAPGFKVIYRSAFRWLDQGGNVLPNHYEMFSAETLARDFGYDLVLDLGYAAILRDPSALAQQPAAVDGAMRAVAEALPPRPMEASAFGYQMSPLALTTLHDRFAALAAALAAQHQEPTT